MSPQFVDFNADGKLDIVAGTYAGCPFVAYGTSEGFAEPKQILDAAGQQIVLNQFYDLEKNNWESTTRCNPPDVTVPDGHLDSAVAFDWDADGDFDLLLGDHNGGVMYRRMNDGNARAPKFASVNLPLMVGDQLLVVPGTVTTPRLIDWDKDGLTDLLIGGMGGMGKRSGGVFLYRNTGKKGAPAFAAPISMLPEATPNAEPPARPDSGFYPDVADVDGDGDYDLFVGGYSNWNPAQRRLDEKDQARLAEIRNEVAELDKKMNAHSEALSQLLQGLDQQQAQAKQQEYIDKHGEEWAALSSKRTALSNELEGLSGEPRREAFVWYYENLDGGPTGTK